MLYQFRCGDTGYTCLTGIDAPPLATVIPIRSGLEASSETVPALVRKVLTTGILLVVPGRH